MGICNVQELNGKVEELIREFEKDKLKLLRITEKKKAKTCTGTQELWRIGEKNL